MSPPFAKPPAKPWREATDTSVMALSAVHDPARVLDAAKQTAKVKPRKIRKRKS